MDCHANFFFLRPFYEQSEREGAGTEEQSVQKGRRRCGGTVFGEIAMAAHITRRHGMRVVLSAVVVLFLSQEVAARRRLLQDGDACVTADFPLAFRHPVTFNVNEGLGVFKDDSTNLECHCEDHHW
jgi:hypothetical protein